MLLRQCGGFLEGQCRSTTLPTISIFAESLMRNASRPHSVPEMFAGQKWIGGLFSMEQVLLAECAAMVDQFTDAGTLSPPDKSVAWVDHASFCIP
jgi:hypothetical protein